MGSFRIALVVSAAIGIGLFSLGAGPVDAKRRSTCRTRGETVAANKSVRVYKLVARDSPDDYVARACVLATGQVRRIGVYLDYGGGVANFRVAGVYVAWAYGVCDKDTSGAGCQSNVSVMNVLNGKVRRTATDHRGVGFAAPMLTPEGNAAWVYDPPGSGGQRTYEVWKFDSHGQVLLDSGPDIDPGSLAIAGPRLYWTKGASAFVAWLE